VPDHLTSKELGIAIAFARLELLELENGRRGLTQCPGIENVAKAIAKARGAVPPNACPPTHEAADAFWKYWRENGETHKHGYYESTWGAINAALRTAVTKPAVDQKTCAHEWTDVARCLVCDLTYDMYEGDASETSAAKRCPTCDSPEPSRYPTGNYGESRTDTCNDQWHR
jgi:hypothetical protein